MMKPYQRARDLRKTMPLPEILLWQILRQTPYHFRRQVPKDGYILDFAALRYKLIIEIDGENHFTDNLQWLKDSARDTHFKAQGYKMLRYSNTEIMENCAGVGQDILTHLNKQTPLF